MVVLLGGTCFTATFSFAGLLTLATIASGLAAAFSFAAILTFAGILTLAGLRGLIGHESSGGPGLVGPVPRRVGVRGSFET